MVALPEGKKLLATIRFGSLIINDLIIAEILKKVNHSSKWTYQPWRSGALLLPDWLDFSLS